MYQVQNQKPAQRFHITHEREDKLQNHSEGGQHKEPHPLHKQAHSKGIADDYQHEHKVNQDTFVTLGCDDFVEFLLKSSKAISSYDGSVQKADTKYAVACDFEEIMFGVDEIKYHEK